MINSGLTRSRFMPPTDGVDELALIWCRGECGWSSPTAQRSRGWLRLQTRRVGKTHDLSAQPPGGAEALDAYLEASGLEHGREALFQSVDRVGDGAAVDAAGGAGDDQAAGGGRRAVALDLLPTSRATGITAYLSNEGTLAHAQQIAGRRLRIPVKLNAESGEREHGFRRT